MGRRVRRVQSVEPVADYRSYQWQEPYEETLGDQLLSREKTGANEQSSHKQLVSDNDETQSDYQ